MEIIQSGETCLTVLTGKGTTDAADGDNPIPRFAVRPWRTVWLAYAGRDFGKESDWRFLEVYRFAGFGLRALMTSVA